MDKAEAKRSIFGLQQRVGRVLGRYAIESWRTLDVPVAQLKSLFIIAYRGETNFHMLAKDLGVTSGNVTGIVDRLVEQGLVTRTADPQDRRVSWLKATEAGCALLTNLIDAQNKHMTCIMDLMTEEELVSFSLGLTGFIRAVEEHQSETEVVEDREK
jgi:MarR family transcriptional regulator, organic hydroperoxide resistance regulator